MSPAAAVAAATIMTDDNDHRTFVREWLAATTPALSTAQVVRLFEDGFAAMWKRAHITLGEVTLAAIVDRVLYDAAERHPVLSTLGTEPARLHFDRLGERAGELAPPQMVAAVEAVLVEFLTVLGNLTAEILTPALNAALSDVIPTPSNGAARSAREDVSR